MPPSDENAGSFQHIPERQAARAGSGPQFALGHPKGYPASPQMAVYRLSFSCEVVKFKG
jgi:hypothetical protein